MSESEQPEVLGKAEAGVRRPRRVRIGVVQSDVRDKTIKVRIDRLSKHPKYGKYLKRRGVLHAHDEQNQASCGDLVEIMECRPISKAKAWRLSRVMRRFGES